KKREKKKREKKREKPVPRALLFPNSSTRSVTYGRRIARAIRHPRDPSPA
ncbi:hypothetical protein BHE74_00032071, partial [Ensete ventricosum]